MAEPKTLRYRLLHVAARIVRHTCRVILRWQRSWPWAVALARAFARLVSYPALLNANNAEDSSTHSGSHRHAIRRRLDLRGQPTNTKPPQPGTHHPKMHPHGPTAAHTTATHALMKAEARSLDDPLRHRLSMPIRGCKQPYRQTSGAP